MMLEIGHIRRAHGTDGEVRVRLTSDRSDRLDPGSELSCDRGALRVVTSRPHARDWLVRFAGIDDRERADSLAGQVLYAEADDDASGLWVHRIVGLEVIDTHGIERGTVVAVQANPAHDLLVLDDGTLVPAVFITRVDDSVAVDVPEGLFE